MGSLRNPIGPLPSTIYWRRRAVMLSVVALLALLVTWLVTSGGGGAKHDADGSNGKNPASSITPGPSGSGPAISQAPGGRDESTGGGTASPSDSGSASGSASGSDSGAGGSDGSAGGDDSASSGGGSGDGSGGGGGTGALPAGSSLPNCTASVITLTLNSVRNTYTPDQEPAFRLTAKNSSANDCKVDLGPQNTVLTITRTGNGGAYWASDDCPGDSTNRFYRVPAGSSATYIVKWDRKPSVPKCATPPAGSAGPGTYLVEAKAPGFPKKQTSFVLSAD
ncbi:hypothetical protein [Streptomyces adustus]